MRGGVADDGGASGTVAMSDRGALQWWIACPPDLGGYTASVVGDVDGDGHADLGFAGESSGFVAFGPLSGRVDPGTVALSVVAQSSAGEDLFGAPASPGDVDGDGGAEVAFATSVAGVPAVALVWIAAGTWCSPRRRSPGGDAPHRRPERGGPRLAPVRREPAPVNPRARISPCS